MDCYPGLRFTPRAGTAHPAAPDDPGSDCRHATYADLAEAQSRQSRQDDPGSGLSPPRAVLASFATAQDNNGRLPRPSGLTGTEILTPAARRAVFAGCIGFAVDFFDIYLPVLALAPVIAYFGPKGLSSAASTTIYFFTFAATL